MAGLTITTYQWTLSAIIQAIAAMSAIVAVFLVFLLSDRVGRRDDYWRDLSDRLQKLMGFMGRWARGATLDQEVSRSLLRTLDEQDPSVARFLRGEDQGDINLVLGRKWNRYTVARDWATKIRRASEHFGLERLGPYGILENLNGVRVQSDEFEQAIRGMKLELVGPGVLSAFTMISGAILLSLSDIAFAGGCRNAMPWAPWGLGVVVGLAIGSVVWTVIAVARLLTRWDQ